jgi:hypothetical protein
MERNVIDGQFTTAQGSMRRRCEPASKVTDVSFGQSQKVFRDRVSSEAGMQIAKTDEQWQNA